MRLLEMIATMTIVTQTMMTARATRMEMPNESPQCLANEVEHVE